MTDLERIVLINILDSDYMSAGGEDRIGDPVWSFSVTHQNKAFAGALGSLVKKGLAKCYKHPGEDETCSITREGYLALAAVAQDYLELLKPQLEELKAKHPGSLDDPELRDPRQLINLGSRVRILEELESFHNAQTVSQ